MSEDNQKRNLIALVASAGLIVVMLAAWVYVSFVPSGDAENSLVSSQPEDLAEEAAQPDEIIVDPEAFAELKRKAKDSFDEIQKLPSRAGSAGQELTRALGKMQGSMNRAEAAEAESDLPLAQKEYQGLLNQTEYFHSLQEVESKRNVPLVKKAEVWARYDDAFAEADATSLRSLYDELNGMVSDADAAFGNNEFQQAAESLASASRSLDSFPDRIEKIVTKYWALGQESMDQGDRENAENAFFVVESVNPSYPGLDVAKRRATTIHIVRPKELKAMEFEKGEIFEMAQGMYEEILNLDPLSTIAKEGVERLAASASQRAIKATGLALEKAIAEQQWMQAQGLLKDFKSLAPGDARIANYDTIIQRQLDRIRIDELKAKALAAESNFDWRIAVETYESILLINEDLADIRESYERALTGRDYANAAQDAIRRAELHAEYDEAGRLKKAVDLLVQAEQRYGLKPETHEKIARLRDRYENRILELQEPVRVKLVSDGRTKVNIWKVGRFEPFAEKEIMLRPGVYRVQGLRSGYVEKFFEASVLPLKANQAIEIICDEKS